MPAKFGVQLPQTNIPWPEYLALWQELDDSPFDSAWTMDHFVTGRTEAEAHGGACLEGWTALAAVAQATRRLRLGWHPQWILSYINADELMFQFVSPELLEGAISFQGIKLATWIDDPAVAEHYRLMREYGGPSPTNFTVYAQTVGEMTVEALSRTCDNLTREGLLDAVESLTDYHSDLFLDEVNISLSDTDHRVLEDGIMLRAVVDEDGKGRWEFFGPLFEFR